MQCISCPQSVGQILRYFYRFVEKIITTLKELHAPIQPLKVFHCGGDEVPLGAWSGAPACRSFYGLGHDHENQDSDEEFDK